MTTKPRIGELVSEAKNFVVANRAYMWDYIRPLLAGIIVCEAISAIGSVYWKGFGIAGLGTAYFYTCFVLAWHRAVLLGPKPSHAVHPFALKKGEGSFIRTAFGIGLIPVLFGFAAGIPIGIGVVMHNTTLIAVFSLILAVLIIYGVILTMRLIFILPAKSVNAPTSFREAKAISRGLVGTFFAAGTLWALAAIAIIVIWSIFVALILFGALGISPESLPGAILIFVFGRLPGMVVNLFLIAFNVTILSRLYQWSVQNRPQGQVT